MKKFCEMIVRFRRVGLACFAVAGLAVLKSHFGLVITVGQSMAPTLNTGDLLILDKHSYQDSEPWRGDMVVVHYRNELIVKRVVGLPGEEVEVKNGRLYIDGKSISESHPVQEGNLEIGKGKLAAGRFAVLGDNRSLPASQTVHAVISKDQIVGKTIFSIRLPHWNRQEESGEKNA